MRFCGENFLKKVFPTPLSKTFHTYYPSKLQAKYADRTIAPARNGDPCPFFSLGGRGDAFVGEELFEKSSSPMPPPQKLSAQYIRTKFRAEYADRTIALARNGDPCPFFSHEKLEEQGIVLQRVFALRKPMSTF